LKSEGKESIFKKTELLKNDLKTPFRKENFSKMSEISCCSNHTCTSQFDKTVDEYMTCSLCLQPAYCSEECRLLDWPAHACPNVVQTPSLQVGFAVPYYYEDMLTAEDLQDMPVDSPIFQSFQVNHYNANRTISQYMVPSLVPLEKNAQSKDDEAPIARGKNPAKLLTLLNTNYTLRISVQGRTVDVIGTIPNDMIYKENNTNPTARALSGGGATFKEKARNVFRGGLRRALHHAETSYIFWPQNRRLRENLIEVDLAGDIEVWLLVKDTSGKEKAISYVTAGYKLPVPGKNDVSAAGRKVQQMFRSQLEMKFKGSDLSTKNLYVRRYSDFEGNGIVLTFEITPGSYKAKLVDVEYVVDAERVKVAELPTNVPTVDTKDSLKKTLGSLGMTKDGSDEDDEAPPPPPDDKEELKKSMISTQYKCNVRDFEDIMGLSMALETFIANDSNQNSKSLESHAAIIKEYVHKMQDNQGVAPESIPPEVDVAVMTAVNAMYEPIGLTPKEWERRVTNADVSAFVQAVDDIIEKINQIESGKGAVKAGTAKGTVTQWVRSARSNVLRRDLRKAKAAIDKNEKILSRTTQWDEIQKARTKIMQVI
jgi:hypothetical protein